MDCMSELSPTEGVSVPLRGDLTCVASAPVRAKGWHVCRSLAPQMKAAVTLLLLLTVLPSHAQEPPPLMPRATIFAVDGERTWPIPINGQAVGFALTEPQQHVAIAARLGNGGGHADLDAYLTKRIGPGTSRADEIAHTSFDLAYPQDGWVTLFVDLDLAKGTYWLIIAKPHERAFSSLNWYVANPKQFRTSCGGIGYLGTRSYTFYGDAAEYIPASKFEKKYESAYGFQFEVTAARTADHECSATFVRGFSE